MLATWLISVTQAIKVKPTLKYLRDNIKFYKAVVDHYDEALETLPAAAHPVHAEEL